MGARFKLDENIPRDAEALLRAAHHDVHSVFDEGADGGPDDRLLDLCRSEKRILITLDLDFGDIRLYPPQSHAGGVGTASPIPKHRKYARSSDGGSRVARP